MNDTEKKIIEALRDTPLFCDEHRPCAAKEHAPGYKLAYGIFGWVIGSLIYGCAIMIGVNVVLVGWLDLVPSLGYWTSVAAVAASYAVRNVLWEGVK